MPKVDLSGLRRPARETKTISLRVAGVSEEIQITVRRLGSLDSINIEGFADQAMRELTGTVFLGDDLVVVSRSTAEMVAVLELAQVGGPDDIYTGESLVRIMAADDHAALEILQLAQWCTEVALDSPPAAAAPTAPESASSTDASTSEPGITPSF